MSKNLSLALKDTWLSFKGEFFLLFGKSAAATACHRQLVDVCIERYGADSLDTERARLNLARLLAAGSNDELSECARLVDAIKEARAQRDTVSSNLARLIAIEGYLAERAQKLDEAEALYKRSHVVFMITVPISFEHGDVLDRLSALYTKMGNEGKARYYGVKADRVRNLYAARRVRRRYY